MRWGRPRPGSGADTASLLFQSAWTRHAEMGLAGDIGFVIKVSADGANWNEAMRADPEAQAIRWAPAAIVRMELEDTSLRVDVPVTGTAVQSDATEVTAGRLMLAQYGYSHGNSLGVVSQTGGTPTGALIERGSNANGEYVRFADGTQICTNANAAITTAPAAFVGTITKKIRWQQALAGRVVLMQVSFHPCGEMLDPNQIRTDHG